MSARVAAAALLAFLAAADASWAQPTGMTGGFSPPRAAPIISMGSIGGISGSVAVYISPLGVDQAEARVQIRVGDKTVLDTLRCVASAAPSQNVTVQGRTGTCGALDNDADMICTISASTTTCDDNDVMLVDNGECYAFKVTAAAPLSTPIVVDCWAERTM